MSPRRVLLHGVRARPAFAIYAGGLGIGDPDPDDDAFDEHDAARVDRRDRELLHQVLEREVLAADGQRPRWLDIMRASVAMSQWRFSSDRQVEDYVARMYAAAG